MVIAPGACLLHYRVIEPLGRGGMGEVWLAEDTRLGRRVALKVLPAEMARDPERRARFEGEARAVAALSHPNIVTVHAVEQAGPDNGGSQPVHFITMELVEGESLSRRIPSNGLSLDALLDIALPLTDALAAAHERGITHRDLKPDNVMIATDGRLKVLDFGLAKQALMSGPDPDGETLAAGSGFTREGSIVGTVEYMSPEQAEGRPVDPRSDVFSLGVLLYELATGRHPFRADTPISTISAILKDHPPPTHEVKPDLPRELGRIIARCLAKDPAARYPTAAELRRELSTLGKASPQSQRSWWLPLILVVIVLVALMAFGPRVARKLGGPVERGPGPAAATRHDGPSVAVLPFVNLSADPANEYFSDGLSETLTHKLAQLRNLRVAARTSAFAFKGRNEDVRRIAEQLGVSTVLEGSVQKAGHRLRITAQLVDATDGTPVFSRTFDRTDEDVFAIQDEIAHEVVAALKVQLLGGESERLEKSGTNSVEAYNAYLLGLQRLASQDWEDFRDALGYFRSAVEADPSYALAWAKIAEAHLWMAGTGLISGAESTAGATPAVERALSIDPDLPEALALRGTLQADTGHRDEAEADYARALELNPGSSTVQLMWALFLMDGLRYADAVGVLDSALERDPLNLLLLGIRAICHEGTGEFDRVRADLARTREIDPQNARGYYGEGFLAIYSYGNLNEAVSWLKRSVEMDPDDYELSSVLAQVYLDLGDLESAKTWLDRSLADGPGGTRPRVMSVYYLVRTGKRAEASRQARSLIEDPAFVHRANSRSDLLRVAVDGLDPKQAAALIESVFPTFRGDGFSFADISWDFPVRTALEYARAEVDYARIEAALGDHATAERFLADAEAFTRVVPRMGRLGFQTLDAEIAALRGNPDLAMELLRKTVDAGWVDRWWWHLRENPNLASLHDRADYRSLVAGFE